MSKTALRAGQQAAGARLGVELEILGSKNIAECLQMPQAGLC